jgi:hypothetical protein
MFCGVFSSVGFLVRQLITIEILSGNPQHQSHSTVSIIPEILLQCFTEFSQEKLITLKRVSIHSMNRQNLTHKSQE